MSVQIWLKAFRCCSFLFSLSGYLFLALLDDTESLNFSTPLSFSWKPWWRFLARALLAVLFNFIHGLVKASSELVHGFTVAILLQLLYLFAAAVQGIARRSTMHREHSIQDCDYEGCIQSTSLWPKLAWCVYFDCHYHFAISSTN